MMATELLAPWHKQFRGQLAGSVYAAAPEARVEAAQALSAAQLDVHVDVMAESEGLPAGVSLTELNRIADTVDPARIGVHLIGSADFVDTILQSVLAVRPAVVFVPWAAFTDERAAAIRAAGAQAWIALWREWDGLDEASAPQWPSRPDGVLVMLIEPGTKNRCALGRLAVVTACAGDLPVAVDGGVTESVAELCVTAGASSIVVGRALLAGPASGEGAK
ncbi:ribulose phosphate epimerase [Mycobacterium sp. MS1601]|uniref:ribulose phosphate epimerase n=1 Tax=Mycobacterium sp. MS1601 TaxID=1936029 RepID=UPI000979664B|nr:ribulose phosphate epimerase [Mycobacterium sp. MS1601]AQA02398.1 ribulose phosphate epimerase [Mycobacterium sp. MS1601]